MDGRVDLVLDGGACAGPGATTVDITEPYWRMIKTGALSITGGGKVDISNGKVISAAPAGTWTGQSSDGSVGQGYDVAASGRHVRLWVERLGPPAPDEAGSGFFRLQLAELEVYPPEE